MTARKTRKTTPKQNGKFEENKNIRAYATHSFGIMCGRRIKIERTHITERRK